MLWGRTLAVCAGFGFDIGLPGGHRRGETPVLMPNMVVKLSFADGIVRVIVWESRSLLGVFSKSEVMIDVGLFLYG